MIGWDWFFSCAQLQLLLVTGGLLSIYNGAADDDNYAFGCSGVRSLKALQSLYTLHVVAQ